MQSLGSTSARIRAATASWPPDEPAPPARAGGAGRIRSAASGRRRALSVHVALRRAGSLLHATAQDSGDSTRRLSPTPARKTGCSCALGRVLGPSARPGCQPVSVTPDARQRPRLRLRRHAASVRRARGSCGAERAWMARAGVVPSAGWGLPRQLRRAVAPPRLHRCARLVVGLPDVAVGRAPAASLRAQRAHSGRATRFRFAWRQPRALPLARRSAANSRPMRAFGGGIAGHGCLLRADGVGARAQRARAVQMRLPFAPKLFCIWGLEGPQAPRGSHSGLVPQLGPRDMEGKGAV
jgi:hypothetical protein